MKLSLEEQVKTIERIVRGLEDSFTCIQKISYIHLYLENDPRFSHQAIDKVIADISTELKSQEKAKDMKK